MSERKVEKLFVARIGIALMTGGEGYFVFTWPSQPLSFRGSEAIRPNIIKLREIDYIAE